MSYPRQIRARKKIDALTGIKSSLDHIRSVISLLYLLYIANNRKPYVQYSVSDGGKTKIDADLLQAIERILGYNNLDSIINNNPLITNQYEPLYVGVTLLMKLGYLKMEGQRSTAERTGGIRYPKQIYFANNTFILDLILQGFIEDIRKTSLYEWLQNKKASNAEFENRVSMFLTTCTVYTQFKLRDDNNDELFFQTEGIYKALVEAEDDVLYSDSHEFVGPTRIYNNVLREDLEPWLGINKGVLSIKDRDELDAVSMGQILSTTLDISNVKDDSSLNQDNDEDDNEREQVESAIAESFYLPYLTAIRTKPFLLLAGISGTGKSRIVRKLAQATDDIDSFAKDEDRWILHKPANFELIQVKPNWHNSMDVVGFQSNIPEPHYEFTPFVDFVVKAWCHENTPFFLCLDEMNLAPVEEYFAEFLSAIESRSVGEDGEFETDPIIKPFDSFGTELSGKMMHHFIEMGYDLPREVEERLRKKGLTLPKNLIVMGTVNMDETTFSFSRKVLDRAMSIEMNEVNYDDFIEGKTEYDVPLLTAQNELLVNRPISAQEVKEGIESQEVMEFLKGVNDILEGTPFKLGYRAANEAILYVAADKQLGANNLKAALDDFTLMKILSRIEGDDSKLVTQQGDKLLDKMYELLNSEGVFGSLENSKSLAKLTNMQDTLKRDHFVSFWG